MNPNALLGAAIGALIGAAVWAAIGYATGYEVGYVAWGIGALVGGLAAKFGSKGSAAGMTCAGLALAAILLGKLGAAHFGIHKELENMAGEHFTPALHAEMVEDAGLFKALGSKADYPQFMLDRRYTEAQLVEEVTQEEVDDFVRYSIPNLQPFLDGSPDYATWALKAKEDFVGEASSEVSAMDVVKEGLGLMDFIFALLGIGTAFKLGEGLGDTPSSGGRARRSGGRRMPPTGGSHDPGTPGTPGPPPVPGKVGQAPVRRRRKR